MATDQLLLLLSIVPNCAGNHGLLNVDVAGGEGEGIVPLAAGPPIAVTAVAARGRGGLGHDSHERGPGRGCDSRGH